MDYVSYVGPFAEVVYFPPHVETFSGWSFQCSAVPLDTDNYKFHIGRVYSYRRTYIQVTLLYSEFGDLVVQRLGTRKDGQYRRDVSLPPVLDRI